MLFQKIDKINEIINKNYNLIGEEALNLKRKFDVLDSNEIKKQIAELDKSSRNLKLGIVGRVKAGKSSLINSLLFEGKDVLPKAATPMTAALTTLSYSEKYEIEIEFFTPEEIEKIKEFYNLYKKKFDDYVEEYKRKVLQKEIEKLEKNKEENQDKIKKLKSFLNMEIGYIPFFEDKKKKEKAINYAKNKLKEDMVLEASFQQYEMIKKGNLEYFNKEKESVTFTSLEELANKLTDYVGSDGKFMPITKIVHIKMPLNFLKEIEIIDTPGINDPIVSREQRTRDLLKICDVVFVVSPAPQFLTAQDIDLMLKVTNDEGIKHINVIASKFDDIFFGSVGIETNYNLDAAITKGYNILDRHLKATISNLIKEHPYIGETFDSLLKDNALIYTSGLAVALLNNYNENEQLIKNLKKYYSSSGDIKEILKRLANLDAFKKAIDEVKSKKIEIMEEKKEEFLKSQKKKIDKFLKELIRILEKYKRDIKSTDIEKLEKEIKELQEKAEKFGYLDVTYNKLKDYFVLSLKNDAEKLINKFFNENGDFDSFVRSETRRKRVWYKLWLGKTDYEVKVLYLNQVKNNISRFLGKFIREINLQIEKDIQDRFYKPIPREIIKTIRELQAGIDKIEAENIIDKILRENILKPNFNEKCCVYKLNKIEDKKIEGEESINSYLIIIENVYIELEKSLKYELDKYITQLESKLDISLKEFFLKDYEKYQLKLKDSIKNKEETLIRLDRVLKELKGLR